MSAEGHPISLALPPGLMNNGTAYQAKGRYTTGDRVRFHNGTIRPIGGWVARNPTGAAVVGAVRGATQYTPDVNGVAQAPVLAFGTTAALYVDIAGVRYDITPTGLAVDADRVWTLEPFGSWLVATAHSLNDYTKNAGVFVWVGDPTAPAVLVSAAPLSPTAHVITPERFFVQLGGVDPLGPNFPNYPTVPSTRTVLWPSQETLTDWIPTAENSAGSFVLQTNGALRCGYAVRGETLLFTTIDLHRMVFIGGEYVYRFEQAGDDCGVASNRAVAGTDSAAFWMGSRGFFMYDGYVKPIRCEVEDYVFGSFNRAYQHLVWAVGNPLFGEVTWFYPSAAATTPDRYVTFNYREGHWTFGTLARAAGVSIQPPGIVPVWISEAGVVYDHETGTTMDATVPVLESGPVEMELGENVFSGQSVIPDERTLGAVNITFLTKMRPMDAAEVTYGPYTLTAKTDVRFTARQVRVRYTQVSASDWRIGTVRLGVVPGGLR
jgi:hypothetical protein